MALYKHELRSGLKSFLVWTVCILASVWVFMAVYPSFAAQGDNLNTLLENFSPDMIRMFGLDNLNFSLGVDYYAYIFQYMLLVTLIQFLLVGSGLIAREEDSGTIHFLYAKPLSRTSIVLTKFLAGLTYIAAFFLIYTALAYSAVAAFDTAPVDFKPMLLFSCAMLLGQLMMLGLGMLLSMFVTRTRTLMSACIGIVLALYVLSMLINTQPDWDALKYFTPFQYFNAQAMLHDGRIEWIYAVLAAGVGAVGLAASLAVYNRRDLKG